MVASRFDNSLYSRPWMARTGVYPGQPAAAPAAVADTPGTTANAPLQIMAGSVPTAPVFMPQGQGEGIGGGGMDPSTSGYGVSPDFGSWANNVLNGLSMIGAGPLGAVLGAGRMAGTMIADPQRATPYGLTDLFGLLGWGGSSGATQQNDPSLPSDTNIDALAGGLASGLGVNQPTGLGIGDQWGQGLSPEVQAAIDAMGGDRGDGYAGSPTGGAATGTGTGTEDQGGTPGVYRRGGYTGAGADGVVQPGMPAGTVHEGEQVINASSTRKYGADNLAPLNDGRVPRNKLAALASRYR